MNQDGRMFTRVREDGLLAPGRPVLVLLSGGRDSTCLLDLAVRVAGSSAVTALHVNYGIRASADEDERHCHEVCASIGVRLEVHRPARPASGNLQAWARDERYRAAAEIAVARGADVAAGHTRTDQVETILYRLASSPSRRALLGMRPREGNLVRPLLGFTREETAAYCVERGLRWREDESNASPAYARNRIRAEVVPASARRPSGGRGERARGGADPARGGGGARRARRRGAGWRRPGVAGRRCARCPPRCAGSWSSASPTTRRAALPRARADAPTRSRRWATVERRCSTSATGVRAVAEYGKLRFEPHGGGQATPSTGRDWRSRAPSRSAVARFAARSPSRRSSRACSTVRRSAPNCWSGPGGRATGSRRSGSAAPRAFRTCSRRGGVPRLERGRGSGRRVGRRDRVGRRRRHVGAVQGDRGHARGGPAQLPQLTSCTMLAAAGERKDRGIGAKKASATPTA